MKILVSDLKTMVDYFQGKNVKHLEVTTDRNCSIGVEFEGTDPADVTHIGVILEGDRLKVYQRMEVTP